MGAHVACLLCTQQASGSAGLNSDIEATLSTASTAIERSKSPSWRQIRKQQLAIGTFQGKIRAVLLTWSMTPDMMMWWVWRL